MHNSILKLFCGFLLCGTLLTGCQQLHIVTDQLMNTDPVTKIPVATEEDPVVELVCLWEAGEGVTVEGSPTRGFAGQVLFFSARQQEPVRIDGTVRIMVFDNLGTPEEQSKPIHQFDFDGTSFNSFLTDTNMGAAYQLFIPYTRKGAHKADCALRIRYTPQSGRPVFSKLAKVVLSGAELPVVDEPIQEEKPEIRQTSYDINVPEDQTRLPVSNTINHQLIKARLSELADDSARIN